MIKKRGVAADIMRNHVRAGTTDQADDIMLVEAQAHTSPERWAQEMSKIFASVPVLAGLSAEISKPGDYKAMDYIGRPLLISCAKDGGVRAMLNVCTHRGMLVAPEEKGNCSRFVCPYPGWTFTNEGALLGVAEKSKFGDVDLSVMGLTQLPVYDRAGLIFVALDPGSDPDFETFFGSALEDINNLGLADAHFVGTREIKGANWKVAFDGYLEGYHFAKAHPKTIYPRSLSNVMQFDAHGPHIRIGFPRRTIIERLGDADAAALETRENDGYDFVRTLFPNVSIFAAPEIVQISQILPGPTCDANRTVMYFLSRKPPATDEDRAQQEGMMDFLRDVVDKEDYGVGLKVQRGLASGAIAHVHFGRNERGNQYFHKWVDYYLTRDPLAVPPVL